MFSISTTIGFSQGTPQALDTYASPIFKSLSLRSQTTVSTPSIGIRLGNIGSNLVVKDSLGVVSTMLSTSLASSTYAPINSPTFTGTVNMPSTNINTRRVATYSDFQDIVNANNFIGEVFVDTDSTNGNQPSKYIVKNNTFQWVLSL